MKGYGRGIWEPCLTFKPGNHRFYVHFAANYKNYLYTLSQNGYQLQDEGVLIHETSMISIMRWMFIRRGKFKENLWFETGMMEDYKAKLIRIN